MKNPYKKIRVAILGFGNLGKFISDKIINTSEAHEIFEIVFIWNRSLNRFKNTAIPKDLIRTGNLFDVLKKEGNIVDIFIEVSHPSVIDKYGESLLEFGNLFISSPTVFADGDVVNRIIAVCENNKRNCFLPVGASWGLFDIIRMNKSIKKLEIIMKKHPDSFKLKAPLDTSIANYKTDRNNKKEFIIFKGTVGQLCRLAPNNVNTMALLALAAPHLGFDNIEAILIANKNLDHHVISIKLESIKGLKVTTERVNPSNKGSVTGKATYDSFMNSLMKLDKARPQNIFEFC